MTDEQDECSRDELHFALKKEAARICEEMGLDSVSIIASGQSGESLMDSHTFYVTALVGNRLAHSMCILDMAEEIRGASGMNQPFNENGDDLLT